MYWEKVIQHFTNGDFLEEQEDLANQIEEGNEHFTQHLSGLTEKETEQLCFDLRNNNDLNPKQLEVLKKMDHIGAYIVLSYSLDLKS